MGSKLVIPDTNIYILGFAGRQPIADVLEDWITHNCLLLSTIAIAEFLVRAIPQDAAKLEMLISRFPVLNIDLSTARLAAQIRRTQLKRKIKLHLPDCLLAAQAKLNNAQLATLNQQDFPASIPLFPLPRL
jgi:predicted nucleic acid-binding protein